MPRKRTHRNFARNKVEPPRAYARGGSTVSSSCLNRKVLLVDAPWDAVLRQHAVGVEVVNGGQDAQHRAAAYERSQEGESCDGRHVCVLAVLTVDAIAAVTSVTSVSPIVAVLAILTITTITTITTVAAILAILTIYAVLAVLSVLAWNNCGFGSGRFGGFLRGRLFGGRFFCRGLLSRGCLLYTSPSPRDS